MNWILSLWLALQSTPAEAEALRTIAPAYLSQWSAAQHLGAARLAATRFDVDVATILAIAYHESRFEITTHTREPGGRFSCGVMTPVPKRRCNEDELTMLGGYIAGAIHLRAWIDACHAADLWRHDVDDEEIRSCALWAYAGGRGFRAYCAARGGQLQGCDVVGQFKRMAVRIRTALELVQ
jgi:hypothetical protein